MNYIVTAIADAEPLAEAIGRLYATSLDKVWPIRSTFPNGDIDPDISHATYYWVIGKPSATGTQAAFLVDTFVTSCMGQEVETTYGDVTVPTETQELTESWFPEVER